MKFHAAVAGPGEASAAEDPDFQAKVAAVFLRHYVSGDFRCAKYGMQRAVNAAIFVDAFVILRARIIVARGKLFHRNFVGRVAIDLVGAHENEHGFRGMLAGGFQEIDRADCVHVKIEQGDVASLIVRWLRGAVDDQIETDFFEQRGDAFAVANVELAMFKSRCGFLQALKVPRGVTRGAEKNAAHVVVHADDLMTLAVEMFHRFRADQPAAACYENPHENTSLFRRPGISASVRRNAFKICAREENSTFALRHRDQRTAHSAAARKHRARTTKRFGNYAHAVASVEPAGCPSFLSMAMIERGGSGRIPSTRRKMGVRIFSILI